MSRNNKNHPLMPRVGSRARLVLVTLAKFADPIAESILMAAHGMDGRAPTIWRQGPYQLLTTSMLIERLHDGRWCVTQRGRELLAEQAAEQGREEASPLPIANMATPRAVPPFRPMVAPSWRNLVVREGAFDYTEIRSLHTGRAPDLNGMELAVQS
jgi:hypothetical protein